MDEENQENVNTTGGNEEQRKQQSQNNNGNITSKFEKAKNWAQKYSKWTKYLPLIVNVIIVVIIILILIGIIQFFTTMPGMYLENIKRFGANVWGEIVGFFNGDNITSKVTKADQIELAQRIQDMGYDVVGYGFADAT